MHGMRPRLGMGKDMREGKGSSEVWSARVLCDARADTQRRGDRVQGVA